MDKIVLDNCILMEPTGHSSKGNQLKWKQGDIWYKADHMGYESLAETLISSLLHYTDAVEYVHYSPVRIVYKETECMGCKSDNFLKPEEELITVEHLFRQFTGRSLAGETGRIPSVKDRVIYMVENIIEFTGIEDFGKYIQMILALDAFFLNEDRHTNNIAVIYQPEKNSYRPAPVFDNGLSLLADTTTDFRMEQSWEECIKKVEAKPFCRSFDEQLDAAEELYGCNIRFSFGRKEVEKVLQSCETYYSVEIIERVRQILYSQMRKYQYLFK